MTNRMILGILTTALALGLVACGGVDDIGTGVETAPGARPHRSTEAEEAAAFGLEAPAIAPDQLRTIELEPESGPISALQWACSPGYSCYYDGFDGVGLFFTTGNCGAYNLGELSPPLNDRASSVWNRGSAWNHLYNWDGVSRWIYLGSIAPGARGNLSASISNIVDGVKVCGSHWPFP